MQIVENPQKHKDINLRPDLRKRTDQLLDAMIKDYYESAPFGSHLKSSDEINIEYYKRHTIEIILRLRMKRTCDALAIRYFTKKDPIRAKQWSHYADDEMLHDTQFFAKDLEQLGVSLEEIYATEPLFTTKLLTGYYQWGLEFEESPLVLITSVYFVEYTTAKTQPSWLDNVEQSLGKKGVRGARGHVNLDVNDSHDDFVWSVLASLIKTPEDEQRMLEHMRNIGKLWVAFFVELYHLTVNKDESKPENIMSTAEGLRLAV